MLKSVYSNVQIRSNLCDCRVLGLINKCVIGYLRRLLFDLSVAASELMLDNGIPFENLKISKDNVHHSLVLPSNICDEPTK